MRKFIRRISILVVFVLVLTSFLGVYAQLDTKKAPKYIFYFIGDGMGISQRKLADIYLDEKNNKNLIMNNFPVNSFIDTRSLNSYITDSAAAGTALATGYKTNNGMISVRPDSDKKLETIVELAENKGLSTGVISTTRLTHATPAVFTAHNKDRGKENEIAIDLLDSGVDFFYGGGLKHFIPSKIKNSERKDNKNLLEKFADK